MSGTAALFDFELKYCIDTNVIVSFLSESDDEFYGADIFPEHWKQIELLIVGGQIIAPRQVERELQNHANKRPKIGPWLKNHAYMFRDVDSHAQLALAKRVVNRYQAYARNVNYLGDLEVMILAGALGIAVVSLELPQQQSSQRRPKIPNVCSEFGISCVSVAGLLRRLQRENTQLSNNDRGGTQITPFILS